MKTRHLLFIAATLLVGNTSVQAQKPLVPLPDFTTNTQCYFVTPGVVYRSINTSIRIGCRASGQNNTFIVDCVSLAAMPYYQQPPYSNPQFPGMKAITADQIEKMPYTNIEDIVSLSTNTYQQRSGGAVQMGGGR